MPKASTVSKTKTKTATNTLVGVMFAVGIALAAGIAYLGTTGLLKMQYLGPTPAPAPTTCGNGMMDIGEECDGGDHCSTSCKLKTIYQPNAHSQPGMASEKVLGIGDKLKVGEGLNIRIDDIQPWGAAYSIWGRDYNERSSDWGRVLPGTCRLISASGVFRTSDKAPFREFTDSFVEAKQIDPANKKIILDVSTGVAAGLRCRQVAGLSKDLACSFYPTFDHQYIDNGATRVFYYGPGNQLAAEYFADAFRNCLQAYRRKIPALAGIKPIGKNYRQVYEMLGVGTASADYERVNIGSQMFASQAVPTNVAADFHSLISMDCPVGYIPHELGHMLFSRTFLQDVYDAGTKSEPNPDKQYPQGSVALSEGLSEYLPHLLFKDLPDWNAQQYSKTRDDYCGKVSLVDADGSFAGASPTQMLYREIMAGRGFSGSSRYFAGYCFYRRVEQECGEMAIQSLFAKAVQYDGSMEAHPTMFRYLADTCGENMIKALMTDYGFNQALLDVQQKFPNTGFIYKPLNTPGCL